MYVCVYIYIYIYIYILTLEGENVTCEIYIGFFNFLAC